MSNDDQPVQPEREPYWDPDDGALVVPDLEGIGVDDDAEAYDAGPGDHDGIAPGDEVME